MEQLNDSDYKLEKRLTTTCLSSQRSLASVPSLNSRSQSHLSTSHNCLTTLKGHTSSYTSSLTLTPKFLFTGSSHREIKSWNRTHFHSHPHQKSSTFNTINIVAGNGAVKSIVTHSNKLFTAHQDHKIRVWEINVNSNTTEDDHEPKCTHLATLPTFSNRISKILIPKNHVRIRRHKKCTWVHHVDAVSSLALSKDGTLLYSVSWDRTIKIWRTNDFTCLESVRDAHDDAVNAIAVSEDGYVYTGSADKRIKVWKNKEKQEKKCYSLLSLVDTTEKHISGINALALSSDERVLYSGACDRSILVWEKDVENGKLVIMGALRGHTKSILCLAVVSNLVCSGSEDKTIRIWRGTLLKEYSCLAVLEGHRGPIKALTATLDDCEDEPSETSFLIYSGSLDCDIKVWQICVPEYSTSNHIMT